MATKLVSTQDMGEDTHGHADILTVELSSTVGIEDALRSGIADVAREHPDLEFRRFTVVKVEGEVQNNAPSNFVLLVEMLGYHQD
jgi:hypothetical protein